MKVISLFMLALLVSCSVIGPGERGVRLHAGRADTEILQPGIHLYFPVLYGVATMDTQVQKSEIETSASTKDLQEITAKLAVNWSINPDRVVSVYTLVGDESTFYERVIAPSVNEIMKSASALLTAEEVLTRRLEMKKNIDNSLQQRLTTYGINVLDVNIVNLAFSKAFMEAVEHKQISEQRAKQAEYETQQAVQTAKAEVNRARGQAEAQRLLQQSLTHDVLVLKYLERWSGILPQVVTSGNSSMLFDLNTLQHK